MENNQNVVWRVSGKIDNLHRFKNVVENLERESRKEDGTLLYLWSISEDEGEFSDLDCYYDEDSAFKHLEMWSKYADEFASCATVEQMLILGNYSEELHQLLESMYPLSIPYIGGFVKENPNGIGLNDIVWTLEGKVTNSYKFRDAMDLLTTNSITEDGTLMNWWSFDEQTEKFCILERYSDDIAAQNHLGVWNRFGNVLLDAIELENFITYSPLSYELEKGIKALQPSKMQLLGGFAR